MAPFFAMFSANRWGGGGVLGCAGLHVALGMGLRRVAGRDFTIIADVIIYVSGIGKPLDRWTAFHSAQATPLISILVSLLHCGK